MAAVTSTVKISSLITASQKDFVFNDLTKNLVIDVECYFDSIRIHAASVKFCEPLTSKYVVILSPELSSSEDPAFENPAMIKAHKCLIHTNSTQKGFRFSTFGKFGSASHFVHATYRDLNEPVILDGIYRAFMYEESGQPEAAAPDTPGALLPERCESVDSPLILFRPSPGQSMCLGRRAIGD